MGDEHDSQPNARTYGLVNLAAFLAQSMKETIKYDACDENNWDATTGYPASNACGQLGQSYQVRGLPPTLGLALTRHSVAVAAGSRRTFG